MSELSAAQRARAERQRARAAALRAAAARHSQPPAAAAAAGGGFLPEPEPTPASRAPTAPPAPLHAHERTVCLECGQRFSHSYLLTEFDYSVCDECRDPEGAHGLVTRTEAKSEFLLTDVDLDQRWEPLRSQRRPNPHRGGHDMRLYLRAQVEERALLVWGSEEQLQQQRQQRETQRQQQQQRKQRKQLTALRQHVRSSLYAHTRDTHTHTWGAESHVGDDTYEHTCTQCGLTQTYEKM